MEFEETPGDLPGVSRSDGGPHPARPSDAARPQGASDTIDLLLIEDDEGDAVIVEELLKETGLPVRINWVRTLHAAREYLSGFRGCVLLDLNLPDASGSAVLDQVLDQGRDAAVLVFTGIADEHQGAAAVAAGAQDYLVKGQVDGGLLARSLRYSLERKRADENMRRLREADLRAQENLRLERGLLPQPLLANSALWHKSFYRPGRKRALVGGDFFDAVEIDGTAHMIIGDVSGHGPDEAALGVCLRIAWRALVMTGVPEEEILTTLEKVLVSERSQDEAYATLCALSLEIATGRLRLRLLGHPPPIVITDRTRELACEARPPLGVAPGEETAVLETELAPGSLLLLYTDGLIDARDGAANERLGVAGLHRLLERAIERRGSWDELPGLLIEDAERYNGGPLQDDVAMLLIAFGGTV
ncbi:PP2C family protein-serine/threonine phosphatase [Allonocardiopsis opalescens]|uniref:Serine phosphatase RsbU (Regulator of sigma subunit) n=1 Tax=Allonocardiopsis opalescens TaxID=1144618 RepID=A0A2T0PW03_9ACTN|nr:fused response regulator/phosphatase [Allonocardiopsis opalescens]PRX95716.1 serine phosphatase RsbU (regulator of sigma subunit) [Allonocardiopsis opalescens]